MPTSISNSNSSVYDRSTQVSQAADCDPTNATCSVAPVSGGQASPPVTIPEVHIEGDAGKQELLRRLEARKAPDCSTETKNAILACAAAGATAIGGVAASTTGIGLVGGVALTLTASAYCGKELRAVHDCEQK